MENKKIKAMFEKKRKDFEKFTECMIGYPVNLDYDYSALSGFLNYSINNVGDPFIESNYKVSSHKFEREILKYFGRLYKIKSSELWGYITNGGTEGNMYGIYIGREIHPKGTLYFSDNSHYSIEKIAHILRMKYKKVPSSPDGSIDLEKLEKILKRTRSTPIFSLNIGTTMKGATDDVDGLCKVLRRLKIKDYYIHCDAALFGAMHPFLKGSPTLSFEQPIGSLAISGHKFIGSPIPCGIVLTRKEYVKKVSSSIEYISGVDDTITGSRNGLTPMMIWYTLQTKGSKGFKKDAESCIENAKYMQSEMLKIPWPTCLNKFSNIVYFKKPRKEVIKKWVLATQEDFSHVVVMQTVSKKKIDRFVNDIKVQAKKAK